MACLITQNETKHIPLLLACGISKMKYNSGYIWVVGLKVSFNLLLYFVQCLLVFPHKHELLIEMIEKENYRIIF
jgi:hypothetical protein